MAFFKEPHPSEQDFYEDSVFTNVEAFLVLVTLF